MQKDILKRVRKVKEVIYYLEPETGDRGRGIGNGEANSTPIPQPPTPITCPPISDIGEAPSRLFDGLTFLMFRGSVRFGDVISRKCQPQQFRLLWYLDCFDGVADLENAIKECWDEPVSLESAQRAFRMIDNIFLELDVKAGISISETTVTVNR